MKKILLITIVLFLTILGTNLVFAADSTKTEYVNVRVTEDIPGANCKQVLDESGERVKIEENTYLYDCQVKKDSAQIIGMLGEIIKYFTYIASLVGVLFIVFNGIMYSMGGMDDSMKESAKKRIIGTIIGLVILFLSGPFLQLIAPWIYK